ncbi:MAG: domain containing protein [Bacteroidetes bacterium]|jgi:PKD repeat protein|nr:domain containing protein [Bacteroidota bacterium]
MKKLLTIFFLLCFLRISFSQELLHCGSDEMRISTLKANPEIAKAVIRKDAELEAFTQEYVRQFYHNRMPSATYMIPVVYHVIHNYGIENISNAQLLDGITVLNKTFRKQAADTNSIVAAFKPLHADCDIEFRLATIDPDGNCTSGINRIASSLTTPGDHRVKSLIQWPTDKYLNIYVVQNAAGLAGHAVWPADADSIPAWDGIVMSHNYVGSIGTSNPTQSVVLAHECGHYLNLQHIWGGNNVPGFYFYPCADPFKDCNIDDLVADTPPTIGWQSCNLNGASCGNTVDNVQNAMDYSYCNKMFTYGQKARMHACLNSPIAGRNNLWQTSNLIATGTDTQIQPLCAADFSSNKTVVCNTSGINQIVFSNTSYNGSVTSLQWTFPGGTPASSSALSPTVSYSTPGTFPVTLKVFNGTDSTMVTKTNFISVLPSTGNTYPFIEGFESTSSLTGPQWYSNTFDTINRWQLTSSAASTGSNSVMLDNFNNTMNTKDELISPMIDLTGGSNLSFTFKYAYARKDTLSQDQLQVYVSKDCISSWIQRLNLIGSALETVQPQAIPFIPTSITEWQQASITIPASYYTANFRFKFVFTSKGGNNIFIDDINIDLSSGIDDLNNKLDNFNVYPNPITDLLHVAFLSEETKQLNFKVVDILGQAVYNLNTSIVKGNHEITIDLKQLSSGLYFLKVNDGRMEFSKKILVNK